MYFPFPLLISIHPGSWGKSCFDSVTIFIDCMRKTERQTVGKRQKDRPVRQREVVCTINCKKQKRQFFKQALTPLWYIYIFMTGKLFLLSQLFAGGVGVCKGYLFLVTFWEFFSFLLMPATQNSPARVNINAKLTTTNMPQFLLRQALCRVPFVRAIFVTWFSLCMHLCICMLLYTRHGGL